MSAGPGRVEAIDQYRGIAIILMVIANYLADIVTIPPWLKHAPDIGLTPIDLIAPFFIFAIALTYGPSYRRRVGQCGAGRTWGHFLRRFLAIIGIGAAGILSLPALALGPPWRALVGLLLLGLYQALLGAFWLPTVLHSPHGGLQGSLSWGAMLILATALALAFLAPVSKTRVSASYVLISLGANPLFLYVMHYLLLGLFVLPGVPRWHAEAPTALVVAQAAFIVGALSVFAWLLARRDRRIFL